MISMRASWFVSANGRLWITALLLVANFVLSIDAAWSTGPRGGPNAAVRDNNIPQSVQIGDERGFFASGTVIGTNTVITCAHCADGGFLLNGQTAYQSHANRFRTLSGTGAPADPRTFGASTAGLAIIHPNYSFTTVGSNDMALLISPTPIALPGGAAPASIILPNADGLVNGSVITWAGYGGAASLPAPPANSPFGSQQDRLRGSSPVTGLTANQISFSVTNPAPPAPGAVVGPNDVASQYTEPGDSGAGYFATVVPFANPLLVGVHNAGNSSNLATNPNLTPISFSGARLTGPNFSSFAAGNGVSATDRTGLIINWNINGNGNFATNNWISGVAGITTPAAGHVAVIARPAANPVVTVAANVAPLYGLVNDDTIDVNGGNLRVTHTARAAGVLNGPNGTVDVRATFELETTALDNVGRLNVHAAGRLTARNDSFNSGTLTINGITPGMVRASGDFSGPNGLRNSNAVNVTGRGSLQTTRYFNLAGATTTITDSLFAALSNVQNAGTITNTGGTATIAGDFTNSGTTTVANGTFVGQFTANDDATNTGTFRVNAGAIGTFGDRFINGAVGPPVTVGAVVADGIAAGTPGRIVFNDDVINNLQSTITASTAGRIDFNGAVTNRSAAGGVQRAKILATGRNAGTASTINFNGNVNSGNFVGDFAAEDGGRLTFAQSLAVGRHGNVSSSGAAGGIPSSVTINGDLEVKAVANAAVSAGGSMTATNLIVAPPIGMSRGGVVTISGAGTNFTSTTADNGGLIEIVFGANATLGDTTNRRGARIVNKGTLTNKFVVNDGRFQKDPSISIVEDFFQFDRAGIIDGDGQIYVGGDWLNRSNQFDEWNMTLIDLIFDDNPLAAGDNIGFDDSLLVSPSRDIFDPSFPGPVLFLDSLALAAGTDAFPTTLDVRGGRIYIEGDLMSLSNFSMDLGTNIIDSLNPSRNLFSGSDPIVRTTSFLPGNNYSIRSLSLAGQDLVYLERYVIPEPSGLLILVLGIIATMSSRRLTS